MILDFYEANELLGEALDNKDFEKYRHLYGLFGIEYASICSACIHKKVCHLAGKGHSVCNYFSKGE